jgi:hypothetical protein
MIYWLFDGNTHIKSFRTRKGAVNYYNKYGKIYETWVFIVMPR